MELVPYLTEEQGWPREGRHVLARFDAETVVVYQAYSPAIGGHAARTGRFGGGFSFERMSWIKPNFLWMMYRSGWGTKEGQEVTLAITLRRAGFDALLAAAVPSSYDGTFASRDAWREAVRSSDVRLQWDPDHDPTGAPLARRAIQLGLRGRALARYAQEWLVRIDDVSDDVARLRAGVSSFRDGTFETPPERVYPVTDPAVARRLRLSPWPTGAPNVATAAPEHQSS